MPKISVIFTKTNRILFIRLDNNLSVIGLEDTIIETDYLRPSRQYECPIEERTVLHYEMVLRKK